MRGQLTSVQGLKAGERVGLWLRNRPECVSALFGVLGAEGVAVAINNFRQACLLYSSPSPRD